MPPDEGLDAESSDVNLDDDSDGDGNVDYDEFLKLYAQAKKGEVTGLGTTSFKEKAKAFSADLADSFAKRKQAKEPEVVDVTDDD